MEAPLETGWTSAIDIYCERTDPSFWAEPVNALTNLGFFVAAAVCFVHWRRVGARDWPALALIVVVLLIWIGSFLFHTVATRWSSLADVIPITIFIYVYFFFAMRRFFAMGMLVALGVTLAFFAVTVAIDSALPPGFMNGSGGYLPAAAAIFVVAMFLVVRKSPVAALVLAAGCVLVVSITARTIDMAVCAAFPLGTHFLWHLLNALTLYILIIAMMRAGRQINTG